MATITTSIEADDSEMTLGFSAGGVDAHALINSANKINKRRFIIWLLTKAVAIF